MYYDELGRFLECASTVDALLIIPLWAPTANVLSIASLPFINGTGYYNR